MNNLMDIFAFWQSISDPRISQKFSMDSIMSPIKILILYIVLLIIIVKLMENREPFELKKFMIGYNLCQVIASFYNSFEIIYLAIQSRFSLTCQPVDYSEDYYAKRMANAIYFYYLMKLADLIDTIIFALRKKSNQISFLHVYHHISMVLTAWSGTKWVAGGQTFLICTLNSLVHAVMYSYYGLAALGPSVQKYLWWKKYLTQFQLIQFTIVISHAITNLFQKDCTYPKGWSWAAIIYTTLMALLFMNFYKKSYGKKMQKVHSN
ncbi:Elongation of very long chain fatty acids 4 [Brachionus plicatilis]|uniref:Elongation of very long chain fatty acids protein n=1 Tax=Brachionus plicatilis TaxID=10195 RepID=A0A3M7RR80_BRAPC|nr:Elongation of very long chain fatty acids 4 [Brachionus plicatilis]